MPLPEFATAVDPRWRWGRDPPPERLSVVVAYDPPTDGVVLLLQPPGAAVPAMDRPVSDPAALRRIVPAPGLVAPLRTRAATLVRRVYGV